MNYLLYGADTYRSRKNLRKMIAGYAPRVRTGTVDVLRFDAAEDDLNKMHTAVSSGSLFGAKKMLVVERPFTVAGQFDITRRVLADAHKDAGMLLVVWDEILDAEGKKRLKETEKYFDKIQEFAVLAGTRLQRWIKKEAAARGAALSAADIVALSVQNGGDTWSIVQEIEKKVSPRSKTDGIFAGAWN